MFAPYSAWPDIPADATRSSAGPGFLVQLDPSYACGQPVELELAKVAAGDSGPWLLGLRVPTGLPLMDEHFRDDMEAGANGWTSEPLIGEESWDVTTADSFSPVQAWYVRSTLARRDTALVMPSLHDLPAGACGPSPSGTTPRRTGTAACWSTASMPEPPGSTPER